MHNIEHCERYAIDGNFRSSYTLFSIVVKFKYNSKASTIKMTLTFALYDYTKLVDETGS